MGTGTAFADAANGSRVLFWCVEEIVGRIPHADFPAGVRSVAAGRGCFATFCIKALNGRDAREQAVAVVTDDVDEQPGNGLGIG